MSGTAPTLAATLHDPDGGFRPFLHAHAGALAMYRRVIVAATETTAPAVCAELARLGASVLPAAPGMVGESRRVALRAALAGDPAAVLLCDFDRWLHWNGAFPAELTGLPARVAALEPAPWYVCLGRTARAFATHPEAQQVPEAATNHALALIVGREIDAVAGAAWLSLEGARLVLADSCESTAATDLEWPALIHRTDPRRLGFLATEGLEFETATFHAGEVAAAGGLEPWITARYERPDVWAQRLRLAADSVAALARVLRAGEPPA